jgi:S-adenosylmethionine decarboxylase
MYWGYHLLLDCGGCDLSAITNKENIKNFVIELAAAINMTTVGEPWIERTAIGIPDKEGYSLYQLIVTSNISAHFVDMSRQIYLDVFSCREYDQSIVIDTVNKYFSPSKIKKHTISRNAG